MSSSSSVLTASASFDRILSGTLDADSLRNEFLDFVSQPLSADLLVECASILRKKMIRIHVTDDAVDTCGTGGSGLKTINTSTIAALLVAAAGGKVAKHGNKSASGNCGCFNLLEHLHIPIALNPTQEQRLFDELGIVFLFAPAHHPSLGFVAPLRKEYGKKTIFNLIGPLCNPAGVHRQIIGTGSEQHARMMAESLQRLDAYGSIVVRGGDGLDEVTATAPTTIHFVTKTCIESSVFSPDDIGLPYSVPSAIAGDSVEENAKIFLELLQGKGDEAKKNLCLVNAAFAMMVAGLADSVLDGFRLSEETLASGKAFTLFQRYRKIASSF